MRVTKEQMAENRVRILNQAARLFREHGYDGIGVDAVCQAAGFSHGNLYSQFQSKEDLFAEAIRHGYVGLSQAAAGTKSIDEFAARYLSDAHRDNRGQGCFMAALASEAPRQSKAVRRNFTVMVDTMMGRLSGFLTEGSKRQREDRALSTVATLVGAMILSRAVEDEELSGRILRAAKSRIGRCA